MLLLSYRYCIEMFVLLERNPANHNGNLYRNRIVSIWEKPKRPFRQQAQCNPDIFIIKIPRRIFRSCVFINIWIRASFAAFPIWKTKKCPNISGSLYKLCTRRGNTKRPTLLSRFKNGILIRTNFVQTESTFKLK